MLSHNLSHHHPILRAPSCGFTYCKVGQDDFRIQDFKRFHGDFNGFHGDFMVTSIGIHVFLTQEIARRKAWKTQWAVSGQEVDMRKGLVLISCEQELLTRSLHANLPSKSEIFQTDQGANFFILSLQVNCFQWIIHDNSVWLKNVVLENLQIHHCITFFGGAV